MGVARPDPHAGRRALHARQRLVTVALHRIPDHLRRKVGTLAGPRGSRAVVRAQADMLRPGFHLACGADGEVWRHWRASLPRHLEATKVTAGRSRGTDARPLWRQVLTRALRFVLTPGWLFTRGRHGWRFPIAVATRDGGCVLLDPPTARVARLQAWGRVPPRQIELRDRWARHIDGPEVRLMDEGRWMLETYVDGDPLPDLPLPAQFAAVRRLFDSYVDLTADARRTGGCNPPSASARELLDAVLHPHVLGRLPEPFRRCLEDRDGLPCLDAAPLVPTVSDCHLRNLVVARNGMPTLIDPWPLEHRPFFYDPLCLVGRIPRALPQLRRAYLDGAFDDELVALFAAAGLGLQPRPESRRSLLATVLLVRAVREAGLRGDRPTYEAGVAAADPDPAAVIHGETFAVVAREIWRASAFGEGPGA